MKKIIFILAVLFAPNANAEVNVFACEPEWKSLAEKIGGENISATSATSYRQDPHYASAKPSLLASMRKADLVICSGAGLEVGWLPILLQKSGSKNVQPGNIGSIMAADYASILGKPSKVDRSMGDIHPEGNPHLHLNPYNILKVGEELTKRFEAIDPANKAAYRKNWQDFEKRWKIKISSWQSKAAGLKGMPVITHHDAWVYLFEWTGVKQAATLEDKPGIPPSTSHLEKLVSVARKENVKVIIRSQYNSGDASEWLSEKTGIPAVIVPFTVNGSDIPDLETMFDKIITILDEHAK